VLRDRWEKGFAFLVREEIAPVLVGEFGGRAVGLDSVEGRWQNQLVDYLGELGLSFTYWSWNPNSSDTGGILQDDWSTVHADKQAMLARVLGTPPPAPDGTGGGGGPPQDPGSLAASVRITDDWGAGYCAQFTISNPGTTTATGVGLRFELADAQPTTTWNGMLESQGTLRIVTLPDWAQTVEPGVVEEGFGFCAVATGPSPYPTGVLAD
jgi:endoglucanase